MVFLLSNREGGSLLRINNGLLFYTYVHCRYVPFYIIINIISMFISISLESPYVNKVVPNAVLNTLSEETRFTISI